MANFEGKVAFITGVAREQLSRPSSKAAGADPS